MITVLRSSGLEFVIYAHDHPPPHLHVIGGGVAKIILVGDNGLPELIYVRRMKNSDLQKALRIVRENQASLLARWRELHG